MVSVKLFHENFFLSDFKNSKTRACFSTFWATFIFWSPAPPPPPHPLKQKLVGTQNSKMRACFITFWVTYFFGDPLPLPPITTKNEKTPDLAWHMFGPKHFFLPTPKRTHLQNTLKHLSAKSEGDRCIFQGVLFVLNINFQYISLCRP